MVLLLQVIKLPTRFSESADETFCADGDSLIFSVFFTQIRALFYFLDTKIRKIKAP